MSSYFLDYDLPDGLIAQRPADRRDRSRLMVVQRHSGTITHHVFDELPNLLRGGDLLILNDSRVLRARLWGLRRQTGGKWEGLFLGQKEEGLWELLCQTRGHLHEGETLGVDPGPLELRLERKCPHGTWLVRPNLPGSPPQLLARHGHIPLPPYIRKGRGDHEDADRYQTVYAHHDGSVAAPTAGLHFTPELFESLERAGISRAFVTLHVGLGTFQPIQTEDPTHHRLHAEWAELPMSTVGSIQACRKRGGRVIAVGTTSVRVLESTASDEALKAWTGETQLFVYPPFNFRVVDGLLTNLHLPRSSLLLLVDAFAGNELTRQAYATAIAERYRFYSYGDAMLIL